MLKNDISAIEEQFNQECTVIEIKIRISRLHGN